MQIKSYKINTPAAQLSDLHNRLKHTRWPHAAKDGGWERGVPQAYLKKLADHWLHLDWHKQEAWLNKYDQFMAEVDGQPIHFFHVKSKEPGALPLMLLHGWPSSNVEFVNMIDQLTDPAAHGGKAEDAFHVVLPTTPGFGLSTPMTEHWDAVRTAKAYSQLMKELGYDKWGVHGGDIGSDIAGEINHFDKGLVGVHCSTDVRTIVSVAMFTGGDPAQNPALSKAQKEAAAAVTAISQNGDGYLEIQKTRPLTIGYLLSDSPVGQLGWIVEKFKEWTDGGKTLPDDAVDIDQLLTNVSLYWFGMSGAASADFICSNMNAQRDWGAQPLAPIGMAVFGATDLAKPLMNADGQFKHWSEFKPGGHFPAMEVPDLLAGDLRAFFHDKR